VFVISCDASMDDIHEVDVLLRWIFSLDFDGPMPAYSIQSGSSLSVLFSFDV